MGARSRTKGVRGELEFVHQLSEALGVAAVRSGLAQARSLCASADVEWPGCPWWFECKRGAKPNHRAALAQAVSAVNLNKSGRVPVVLSRDDREEALVVMRLADWLPMARAILRESDN